MIVGENKNDVGILFFQALESRLGVFSKAWKKRGTRRTQPGHFQEITTGCRLHLYSPLIFCGSEGIAGRSGRWGYINLHVSDIKACRKNSGCGNQTR